MNLEPQWRGHYSPNRIRCAKCGHDLFHTVYIETNLAVATAGCRLCGTEIRVTEEQVEDGNIELLVKK